MLHAAVHSLLLFVGPDIWGYERSMRVLRVVGACVPGAALRFGWSGYGLMGAVIQYVGQWVGERRWEWVDFEQGWGKS